jgi:antitoxin (DNA-binding transcriptional repressor) of toxin-antitoxin stability system
MKVNMSDINKRANLIVNQVAGSRESALIYKHGVPIAEIRPVPEVSDRRRALQYLSLLQPARVSTSLGEVIAKRRRRGV